MANTNDGNPVFGVQLLQHPEWDGDYTQAAEWLNHLWPNELSPGNQDEISPGMITLWIHRSGQSNKLPNGNIDVRGRSQTEAMNIVGQRLRDVLDGLNESVVALTLKVEIYIEEDESGMPAWQSWTSRGSAQLRLSRIQDDVIGFPSDDNVADFDDADEQLTDDDIIYDDDYDYDDEDDDEDDESEELPYPEPPRRIERPGKTFEQQPFQGQFMEHSRDFPRHRPDEDHINIPQGPHMEEAPSGIQVPVTTLEQQANLHRNHRRDIAGEQLLVEQAHFSQQLIERVLDRSESREDRLFSLVVREQKAENQQIESYQKTIRDLMGANADQRANNASLQAKMEVLRSELDHVRDQLNQAEVDLAASRDEEVALGKQLTDLEIENARLKEKIKHAGSESIKDDAMDLLGRALGKMAEDNNKGHQESFTPSQTSQAAQQRPRAPRRPKHPGVVRVSDDEDDDPRPARPMSNRTEPRPPPNGEGLQGVVKDIASEMTLEDIGALLESDGLTNVLNQIQDTPKIVRRSVAKRLLKGVPEQRRRQLSELLDVLKTASEHGLDNT